MFLKLFFLFAVIAFAQQAEIPQLKTPPSEPDPRDQQIAFLKAKITLYQLGLSACEDSQIERRAKEMLRLKAPEGGGVNGQ